MPLLHLPIEIRLNIYTHLFDDDIAYVSGGRQDVGKTAGRATMLPPLTESILPQERGAQLLRTCKAILAEARPVLYKHTIFRSSFQAFAGRLPTRMSNNNPTLPHVRHLEWQLNCDLLKVYDSSDVHITATDVRNLQTVQLNCQAENWKGSLGGEWCDRKMLVKGRQQVIDFGKLLQSRMSDGQRMVTLVEDRRYLSRGRVVLRLLQGKISMSTGVSPLSIF